METIQTADKKEGIDIMAGKKKIVIIGGVAGGATAAARLRRLSETDEIIMFERDEYISFANCGLPYYIGEVITDRQKLLVQTVEGMSQRFNLDIRNLSEVTAIDAQTKTVTVLDRRTNQTYTETFDKLIVSPGASPIWPNMPGMDLDHIFKVRNIPDTDAIYNFIAERQPKTAVVVGGGFIGIEMAEALVERGISVTVVDKSEHILRPFDYEMAAMLQNEMVAHGVTLKLETGVSAIEADAVILEDGAKVAADLVIMAIGVSPETKLAKMAGLELGETGAILVNDQLQTSHPDIYAVGDAIEVKHYITGRATKIPLAWPANRQGRLVADHINGRDIRYTGTLGTSVIKVFALTAAATGLTAELMEFQGIEYQAIHVHRGNHAGYYPGATDISIKLLFDPKTGKILGAQAVGQEGTEKRLDVLATAIKGGLTIEDLPELELSYAPPYSSAKDPVNIAGYVATNVFEGEKVVHWNEIDALAAEGAMLIDVRTAMEFSLGTIGNAVNMPVDELRELAQTITVAKETPLYIICQVGLRGHLAVSILTAAGFTNVSNLSGGYKTYSQVYKNRQNTSCNDGICKPETAGQPLGK